MERNIGTEMLKRETIGGGERRHVPNDGRQRGTRINKQYKLEHYAVFNSTLRYQLVL